MRIHRLVAILVLVENHPGIKAKDIANRLEVSTRTVYRDIDALCEAGFPLYATTGPSGGLCFSEHYHLGLSEVNPSQILPLILKTMPYIGGESGSLSTRIHQGLQVIQKDISTKEPVETLQERIYVDPKSWWGGEEAVFDLEGLVDALWSMTTIEMAYQKHHAEVSERRVQPYGLVLKDKTWYLIAFCQENMSLRTFKCNRIQWMKKTNQHYQIPTDFSIKAYWTQSEKEFLAGKREQEVYPVTMRILKRHGQLLEAYEVQGLQEEPEYYVATINLHREDLAKEDIRHLIGYGEIIGPPLMRETAFKWLREQLGKY